jgi:histidinol-phosphate phosphatase family protein
MLEVLPGAPDAVAKLTRAGIRVFVFTNQAGVGRGYLTAETLEEIHNVLRQNIADAGGVIEAIYACIHHPNAGCDCRKPKPGMLLQAAAEYGVDLTACWTVGDSPRDIAAGSSAGCRTILVLTGHTAEYDPAAFPEPQPDRIFRNVLDAACWLTRDTGT